MRNLFLALILTGCATPKTYRAFTYPGLAKGGGTLLVEEVNRIKLYEFCLDDESKFDNGDEINAFNRDRQIACHTPGHIVYLRGYSCVLGHELCHESDLPASVCDKAYHFEKFCGGE